MRNPMRLKNITGVLIRAISLLILFAGLALSPIPEKAAGSFRSPLVLVPDDDGRHLYVAQATANEIALFDVEKGRVAGRLEIPGPPGGMALAPGGSRLFVTQADPDGLIHLVDTKTFRIEKRLEAGHFPVAPVVSPDGKRLYVCNRFDNTVSVFDLESGKELERLQAVREPVAAVITPDNKWLFVANHLPSGAADGAYAAAGISFFPVGGEGKPGFIPLPNGSTGLRGLSLSHDGRHAYATHILARYQLPTTQLERGWMNTNALSVIDVKNRSLLNTVLLDSVDLGAANPWGVACTPDGRSICVSLAGTHEICLIDRVKLHERLAAAARGEKVTSVSRSSEDVPNDLSFLVGISKRIALAGKGPRGLALAGSRLYAAEYYSDSLGVVDLESGRRKRAKSLPLGPKVAMMKERQGEIFFNDAGLCFQKWQSCASCHPDGRADALNWDLLNDGLGNPKNTKSLLLSHRTPPSMITGIRDDAEMAVRAGLRHIQFAVRPEAEAAAIDAFLESMKPVPSPLLKGGSLSASAERGREIFENAGCASCHPAPLLTNLQKYDVGTGRGREEAIAFDTPTLIEVWRTGPWLYDGRAATMQSLLREHNRMDSHGTTAELTEEQLRDLAEFILSL